MRTIWCIFAHETSLWTIGWYNKRSSICYSRRRWPDIGFRFAHWLTGVDIAKKSCPISCCPVSSIQWKFHNYCQRKRWCCTLGSKRYYTVCVLLKCGAIIGVHIIWSIFSLLFVRFFFLFADQLFVMTVAKIRFRVAWVYVLIRMVVKCWHYDVAFHQFSITLNVPIPFANFIMPITIIHAQWKAAHLPETMTNMSYPDQMISIYTCGVSQMQIVNICSVLLLQFC